MQASECKGGLGIQLSSKGCFWILRGWESSLALFLLFWGLDFLKNRKQNYKWFKGYPLQAMFIYM